MSGSNRIITFQVGGEILVNSTLEISGRNNITIDGSTAPSPGITITAANSSVESALVYIRSSHDIIMRHIRISDAQDPDTGDNLRINYSSYNIIIDHCSFRRAADGNFDIAGDSHDITIQWCVIADTYKNQLIRTNVSNLSLHHNLYVHGDERNPQFQEDTTNFDFVNNVLFDWDTNYGIRVREGSSGNIVKNYFQPGGRSDVSHTVVIRDDAGPVYCEGNVLPSGGSCESTTDERFEAPAITEMTAEEAYDAVLDEAGACPRDIVDEDYIEDVIHGDGF